MIADELIEKVTERLVERMNKANLFVIKKIAKTIKELGTITPSNTHDIISVMDYGGDIDAIMKKLAKMTKLNVKDIYKIFDEVAKNDLHFAKKYYDYKKKKYIPWEENELLRRSVKAIADQTVEKYVNLSNTKGIGYTVKKVVVDRKTGKLKEKLVFKTIDSVYRDLIDEGIVSVSQGKLSFNEAMSKIIKDIGHSGLKSVIYESGRTRRLDSAIRMDLNDGLKQLHNHLQEEFGKEFGADGVEITVHPYPAPDHEEIQGRQFSTVRPSKNELSEYEKLNNDEDCHDYTGRLITADYNGRDRRSISEYNCKHYVFSIVLGVSKPEYTDKQLQDIIDKNEEGFEYNGKHHTMYEGTQMQRKMELEIRKKKDIQIMARESGNEKLESDMQEEVDRLTSDYYNFSKQVGLDTRLERIQVEGWRIKK